MKALVTGGTGFIGANLIRVLQENGRDIRALARKGSDLRNLSPVKVEVASGDLRDAASIQKAVQGCDEVYHVAADYRFWAADPHEIYRSNVEGTRNILQACLESGVRRVVYTSTVGTIGLSRQPSPCDEKTPMDPGQLTSHYKRSKVEAENVALEFAKKGLPVVIVNPSAPIGAWDRKPTPTGKIIVDFVNGKLPAYVDTGLNFVHVRDVAVGQLLAAQKGQVGERYILGNQNLGMPEFLAVLGKVTGRKPPKIRVPYWVAWSAGLLSTGYSDYISHKPPAIALEAVKMSKRYMFFDCAKAIKELGLPQTPIEAAAEDAVKWFKDEGFFN